MATYQPCGTTSLASGSSSIPISRLTAAGVNKELRSTLAKYHHGYHHCYQILHIFSGESPLPEAQHSLAPSSPVLGGRLPWDAYNNGGEWLNSVFDLGPSLVG